jgi:hypothetical protein
MNIIDKISKKIAANTVKLPLNTLDLCQINQKIDNKLSTNFKATLLSS